jgi:type VI secretion system secreted protein Hcp
MAFTICIKIGDIAGESTVANHAGEIDVLSWGWGLNQSASGQVGGAGSGTADVKDLTFTKFVDNSSPTLIQQCFEGNNLGDTVLTVIKANGKEVLEFIKITMSGTVIISSINTGDPLPNDRYSETVTLNFAHVKFEYTPTGPNNSKGATAAGEFTISRRG